MCHLLIYLLHDLLPALHFLLYISIPAYFAAALPALLIHFLLFSIPASHDALQLHFLLYLLLCCFTVPALPGASLSD